MLFNLPQSFVVRRRFWGWGGSDGSQQRRPHVRGRDTYAAWDTAGMVRAVIRPLVSPHLLLMDLQSKCQAFLHSCGSDFWEESRKGLVVPLAPVLGQPFSIFRICRDRLNFLRRAAGLWYTNPANLCSIGGRKGGVQGRPAAASRGRRNLDEKIG